MRRLGYTGRYRIIDKAVLVGTGTYGDVYRAQDTLTDTVVAIKKIRLDEEGIPANILREVALLKQLYHPNIVVLKDVVRDQRRMNLIFEYMEKDLYKYIRELDGDVMEIEEIRSYAYQLYRGLSYCHERGIIHRDLKPQNLLLSNGTLKIADFGLAKAFCPPIRPLTHDVVSLWYRAPEVLLGCETYGLSIDIWAVSLIIYEMATLSPLWMESSEIGTLFEIFKLLGTPSEYNSPEYMELKHWNSMFPHWEPDSLQRLHPEIEYIGELGINLIECGLKLNHEERFTASDALNHSFFDELNNEFNIG